VRKRLLIAWPGPALSKLLEKDSDFVFLDGQGWWIYSEKNQTRSLTKPEFNAHSIPPDVSIVDIRNRLNWWSPVWTRWLGNAEDYELLRATSVFRVMQVICGFKDFYISSVLFHTGVPHHYDSSLVSIACETYGINQIYLYRTVFDSQLIPLIQSRDIFSRKPLGIKVRTYNYLPVIESFIKNKIADKMPETNTSFDLWKTKSCVAKLYAIYLGTRRQVSKVVTHALAKKKNNSWVLSDDYSVCAQIRIVKKQREFIKSYEASIISECQIKRYASSVAPKLLIAAHYQPEATSFPEGGHFFNHLDIALSLRLKGYRDQLLYKEHPASWLYLHNIVGLTRVGLWRSADYVDQLKGLGCVFLPKDYPLSIKPGFSGWYLPVTVTGTIAIERALVGLHTIVTGEPWFKGLPGLLHLSEIETLQTIDKRWVQQDTDIAIAAKNFLNDSLTDCTLTNTLGIGTGKPLYDLKSKDEFAMQFRSFKDLIRS
jgi:hypothetical protein